MNLLCSLPSVLVLFSAAIVPGLNAQVSTRASIARAAAFSSGAQTDGLKSIYGAIPVYFEENLGQTDSKVRFLSRGAGFEFFISGSETVAVLTKGSPTVRSISPVSSHQATVHRQEESALRVKLIGANEQPAIAGEELLEGKSNYFIGNDPAKWHTNIAQYGKVRLSEVYPGIDVVYYGNQQQLEYDFVVRPGSDPRQIRLQFDGAERIEVDPTGDLLFHINGGVVRQQLPAVYQELSGTRHLIRAAYRRISPHQFGVDLASYNSNQPLVIDPILSWSTYLGGSDNDQGAGIGLDGAGNVYVTGFTASLDFPSTGRLPLTGSSIEAKRLGTEGGVGGNPEKVFVAKLNPAGTALSYVAYLGGNGNDAARCIATTSSGELFIAGSTTSTNFPTTSPLQPAYAGNTDLFVAKLNPTGSALLYSTYLGGTDNDEVLAIATQNDNAFVTGFTHSTDFPTTAGALKVSNPKGTTKSIGFVAAIGSIGSSLIYSTYLGGSEFDEGEGIAVDSVGNAYVTGSTSSDDFPTTTGAFQKTFGGNFDAFVTKLTPTGSAIAWSTYLGGSGDDEATDIALDSMGNAYVTGGTVSTDFPITPGALQRGLGGHGDAFVSKVSFDGSGLDYSTYLGGNQDDSGTGIAVDHSGNMYVTGDTSSTDFPTKSSLQESGGNRDVFVSKINADGSAFDFSTYLGGEGDDDPNDIAIDSSGNAYVTGLTESTNFPTTAGALQRNTHGGFADVFIAKIVERRHAVIRE